MLQPVIINIHPMKRFFIFTSSLLLLLTIVFLSAPKIMSDELDDINKQINDLTSALNLSVKATRPLEGELNALKKRVSDIKARTIIIEEDIFIKKKNINKGYEKLAIQEKILNRTIRDFYMRSYYNSPVLLFLSEGAATQLSQILAYQKAAADQDKAIITNIALSIADLETKKKNLEE